MSNRTNRPVRHLVPAVAVFVAVVGWSSPSDAYVQQLRHRLDIYRHVYPSRRWGDILYDLLGPDIWRT